MVTIILSMEHASDCVNMVPLRYRGSRKFAAVHKDIMLGTESTVKETSYRSSYRAPPDTQKTLKDDSVRFYRAPVARNTSPAGTGPGQKTGTIQCHNNLQERFQHMHRSGQRQSRRSR